MVLIQNVASTAADAKYPKISIQDMLATHRRFDRR